MNKSKLGIQLQYAIFNLVAILMIFLDFFTCKISISSIGGFHPQNSLSGMKWLTFLLHPQADLLHFMGLEETEASAKLLMTTNMTATILFLLPFVVLFLGLLLHIVNIRREKGGMIYGIFPAAAFVLTIAEIIVMNYLLNSANNHVTSYNGDTLTLGISFMPAIGCIAFLVICFLLTLEDILFLADFSEAYEADYIQVEPVEREEKKPEAKIYETQEEPAKKPIPQPANRPGVLKCIRGQYRGSEVEMHPGEMIVMGRDKEACQLVFDDPRISRKHCTLFYKGDGEYFLTNLSKNGVKLHNGTNLPFNTPYSISSGMAFRLTEEVVFRVD